MIKDNLTPLAPIISTDPFHISTLRTRLQQLITRDEELANILSGGVVPDSLTEVTGKHELIGKGTVTTEKGPGWLTRVPAYWREGNWTTPVGFSTYYTNASGKPIIYSVSTSNIVFGNINTTYTLDTTTGTFTSRARNAEEAQWGIPGSGVFVIGKAFDGGTIRFAEPGSTWTILSSQTQIYVTKLDNSVINLTTVLPDGRNIVNISPCADQMHVLVLTRDTNISNTNQWHLIKYTGSGVQAVSNGVVDSVWASTGAGPGYVAQSGGFAASCLDSDLKTLWWTHAPGGAVYLIHIDPDNVMRTRDILPLKASGENQYPSGFSYPAIFVKDGIAVIVADTTVTKLYRVPKDPYDLTSAYVKYVSPDNLLTCIDNLEGLALGSGDWSIDLIFEPENQDTYTLLSTNLWSVEIKDANPGPGRLVFRRMGVEVESNAFIKQGIPNFLVIEKYNGIISLYFNGYFRSFQEYVGATDISGYMGIPTNLKVGGGGTFPNFSGKIYAGRITQAARYKGEFHIGELKSGVEDSYWNLTSFFLKVSSNSLYKRRELLNSSRYWPTDWIIDYVGVGIYKITHDFGSDVFSVIPSVVGLGKAITSNYTNTTFQVNTFSPNGTPLDLEFSCLIFQR